MYDLWFWVFSIVIAILFAAAVYLLYLSVKDLR